MPLFVAMAKSSFGEDPPLSCKPLIILLEEVSAAIANKSLFSSSYIHMVYVWMCLRCVHTQQFVHVSIWFCESTK